MNDNLYIILIIGLSIFVIFYGGHNYQNKIEYDTRYFDNLNVVIYLENKINKILKNLSIGENNFINLNEYIDSAHVLLPNFVNCFGIKIKSHDYFNIFNIISVGELKSNMMIIFNFSKSNNLELLINNTENNMYINDNCSNCNGNIIAPTPVLTPVPGYFYSLNKTISITGLYHIYNNSNDDIIITCFIVKKPFWHK